MSAVLTGLVLCAASAVLVWGVHARLSAGLDAALVSRVQDVAAQVSQGQLAAVSATGSASDTVVQVVGAGGRVLAGSGNIAGEPRLFHDRAAAAGVTLRGGADGSDRVATLRSPSPSGPVVVYAARPTAPVGHATRELGAALVLGVPAVVLVLGVIVWLLAGRALAPVEVMRREVAAIPGDHPGRRLDAGSGAVELRRLADTFNRLLERVDRSAGAQRRLVADSAHELRNPVAAILTRLDVRGMTHPITAQDRALLHHEAARLAALVDSLLGLARLDAGARLRPEPVDLDDLVLEHAGRLRLTGHRVDATRVNGAQVLGDRRALEQVVANLVDNAARHARSVVTLTLTGGPDGATLLVQDDGPGIAPSDRERVFDRFTRLDPARDRDHGGFGLGLAIVRQVVQLHGGSIRVEPADPGARFVVTLPWRGPTPAGVRPGPGR